MAGYYNVRQGDFLSKIAKMFGFSDYRTIWNHPNNADLKEERQNPNVLLPGDVVYIPELQRRTHSCSTDQSHVFLMKSANLRLRLVVEDLYEQPIGNALYVLQLGTHAQEVTTDSTGLIDQNIPADIHEASLVIRDEQTPFKDVQLLIKIGDLDPEKETSGQAARLTNLGYFGGDVNQPDRADFQSAVEEFQCDHALMVDGICGPITQARLRKAHGC